MPGKTVQCNTHTATISTARSEKLGLNRRSDDPGICTNSPCSKSTGLDYLKHNWQRFNKRNKGKIRTRWRHRQSRGVKTNDEQVHLCAVF